MKSIRVTRFVLLLACCVPLLVPLLAQSSLGVFKGTVTDSAGAGIPKAEVTIFEEQGEEVKVNTQADGTYVAPNMQSGLYTVSVRPTGFLTYSVSGLQLKAGEEFIQDITLRECPECQPGEWGVTADQLVGPGNDPAPRDYSCSPNMDQHLRQAVRELGKYANPVLGQFAGPLWELVRGEAGKSLDKQLQDSLYKLLEPYLDPKASCQLVGVVIPLDTEYAGYRYEAYDDLPDKSVKCRPGIECPRPLGSCRFVMEPALIKTNTAIIIYTGFRNWAPRERHAKLTVYVRPLR